MYNEYQKRIFIKIGWLEQNNCPGISFGLPKNMLN